jgi:hypothetical protein
VCPNGELISAREKLVLMVLADSHQDQAKRFTYPSVETIAAEALCDRRTCQRYLDALERKGVIRHLRPANQGRGYQVFYFFPALETVPEGWQDAALFFIKREAEGRQKGGRRAAKGRRKGGRRAAPPNRTRAGTGTETGTKANTPPPPLGSSRARRGAGVTRNKPSSMRLTRCAVPWGLKNTNGASGA